MYIINIIKNPNIFFLIITVLIVICALLVILSKNPIHSILFLVLIFVLTTILFLTLNVDFLAMLFLVLYVGAIVVLFLFVVMMLNVRILELKERVISYLPIAIIIVSVFFILIIFVLKLNFLTESSTLQEDTLSGILKSVFDVFHHDMHVLFKEI
jgi:NADH-quinone oxidoreductase subunit J